MIEFIQDLKKHIKFKIQDIADILGCSRQMIYVMLPNEKRKDLLKTALNQIINVKLISLTRQIDELMNEVNVLKMKKDELRKL